MLAIAVTGCTALSRPPEPDEAPPVVVADVAAAAAVEPEPPPKEPLPPEARIGAHDLFLALEHGGLVRLTQRGKFRRVWGASHKVTTLREAPDGRAYALSDGTIRVVALDEGEDLPGAPITLQAIAPTRGGAVWGLSHDALARFDGASWTLDGERIDIVSVGGLKDVAADDSGGVWILGETGILRRSADGKFARLELDHLIAFASTPAGRVAIVHGGGIAEWDGTTLFELDLKIGGWRAQFRDPTYNIDEAVFPPKGDPIFVKGGTAYQPSAGGQREVFRDDSPMLLESKIDAIAADGTGRVWIFTGEGLHLEAADGDRDWPKGSIELIDGMVGLMLARGDGPHVVPVPGEARPAKVRGTILVDGSPRAGLKVQMCADPKIELGSMGSPCEDDGGGMSVAETAEDGTFELVDVAPVDQGLAVFADSWRVLRLRRCCQGLRWGQVKQLGTLEATKGRIADADPAYIRELEREMAEAERENETDT